ncbi:MAG: saccharopine dehydrogenase NADP-binding domain-containing protein, partial [Fervidobacterium sp.]
MENELKIGIVGGSGFVGSSIARHLSKRFKVKVIDPKKPNIRLNRNVEYVACDIRNYGELKNATADLDLVINTA